MFAWSKTSVKPFNALYDFHSLGVSFGRKYVGNALTREQLKDLGIHFSKSVKTFYPTALILKMGLIEDISDAFLC